MVQEIIDYNNAGKPLKNVTLPIGSNAVLEHSKFDVQINNLESDIHRFDLFAQVNNYQFL